MAKKTQNWDLYKKIGNFT